MSCKFPPPLTKSGLADVQSNALLVDAIPPAAVGTLAGGGILGHLQHWWMLLPFAVILIAAWFFMRRQL
jgi:hypothetical protein